MSNKKENAKRLVIFLLLAFGLSWIPWITLTHIFGYDEWFTQGHMGHCYILALIAYYGPALANILTRIITKEGFHDMLLHLKIRGHVKHYLIAWLMPVVFGLCAAIVTNCFFVGWDWNAIKEMNTPKGAISTILMVLATAPLAAFNTFGEEYGWRGYMNQKMEPLFGTVGTVVIGGIIWGVWHAPLTVHGHNYGTDYPGFPYVGILLMCMMCTGFGGVLYWLTKRTGSIYPAAIMHATINNGGLGLASALLVTSQEEATLAQMTLTELPIVAFGVLFTILLLRGKSKETAEKQTA